MFDDDDDFASSLREKTSRTSDVYDDLEEMDDDVSRSGGGVLSRFSPVQRLILAVLALIDVVVIAVVILIVAGIIQL